ncbi:MAG TPA: AAA family ATPase [Ktedonobacterales bacterium]|nr:AAA family ATPase [Ktedonobacterales bacterium]
MQAAESSGEMPAAPRADVERAGQHAPGGGQRPAPRHDGAIQVPVDALVVLIGSAGTGKSTWAARHFEPTQIVSSDACRAAVADDPADQGASHDAFRLFNQIVHDRLKRGLLTVADSTALAAGARRDLLNHAADFGRPAVAVLFDLPLELASAWNGQRERQVPLAALLTHNKLMRQSTVDIPGEGFSAIYVLRTAEDLEAASVHIGRLRPERDRPPFDVIGDVHGCVEELRALLLRLGYARGPAGWAHPEGRRAVFVGDLVDRGPSSVGVLELVLAMLAADQALLVAGNHDNKFMRWLMGRPVRIAREGLATTIEEGNSLPAEERQRLWQRVLPVLAAAPGYLLLDGGRLVVTHAGIQDGMLGRWNRRIASFCLYGDVVGVDAHSRPLRRDWAALRVAGEAAPLIIYGHTVVDELRWVNATLDLDTGCVFGGQLSALRYPEMELVSVPAKRAYATKRVLDVDTEN